MTVDRVQDTTPTTGATDGLLKRVWRGAKAFANERLGIRTWEDLRLQVHALSPTVAGAIVTWGWATEDVAKLIVGVVIAAASPALAFFNTRDGFRRWVYGLLPPAQALIVGVGWATDTTLAPITTVIVALLGGALAGKNTRSSNDPACHDQRAAA